MNCFHRPSIINSSSIARISVWIALCFGVSIAVQAQPQLREGWPVMLDPSPGIVHFNNLFVMQVEQEWVIGASIPDETGLWDIAGNPLPGWPKHFHDDEGIYIVQGPRAGDMDGDGIPEIALYGGPASNARERHLKVYTFTGDPIEALSRIDPYDPPDGAVSFSSPVFADVNNDGLDELLWFTQTELHAFDIDGDDVTGFPWAVGDTSQTAYSNCVVGYGEGWTSEPLIVWLSTNLIHARRIGDPSELPGWPIPHSGDNRSTPLTLLPRDEEWNLAIQDVDHIHLYGPDGSEMEGFPISMPSNGTHLTRAYEVIVADLWGLGEPQLLVKPFHRRMEVFDLEGNYTSVNISTNGAGEPPVVLRDALSDTALIFSAASVYQGYQCDLWASREEYLLDGFPVQHLVPEPFDGPAPVVIFATAPDTIQIVQLLRSTGELFLYSLPHDGGELTFEWSMTGANPQGNRLYRPVTPNLEVADEWQSVPVEWMLSQPYPNPTNALSRLTLSLPVSGKIGIEVTNLLGRRVAGPTTLYRPAGRFDYPIDLTGWSTGVYLVRVAVDNQPTQVRRLVLVK